MLREVGLSAEDSLDNFLGVFIVRDCTYLVGGLFMDLYVVGFFVSLRLWPS